MFFGVFFFLKISLETLNMCVAFLLFFPRNMIKSFYTASLLIDVLTVFGELTDEVSHVTKWCTSLTAGCKEPGFVSSPAKLIITESY